MRGGVENLHFRAGVRDCATRLFQILKLIIIILIDVMLCLKPS